MKLLIACDMEGISGVHNFDQTNPDHHEYQRFRHIMTADVNAAVRGAVESGADEIIVTDGHWNGTNILIEELDARAVLNAGSPSKYSMVEGVDSGVDAAFFIGYHARMGSEHAILDHTWSSTRIKNLWLNGQVVGETGLNGALCGAFNVPVILLSGDQAVCAEARQWIPGIATVQVKRALSRHSAECLPLAVTQEMLFKAAKEAIQRFKMGQMPAPLKVETPVTMVGEFIYSDMADRATMLPGSKRIDGSKVEFTAADMPAAYRAFRAAVGLAQR
jgi:D-amino peptidase